MTESAAPASEAASTAPKAEAPAATVTAAPQQPPPPQEQQQQQPAAAATTSATPPPAHPVKLNANAKSFSPSPAGAMGTSGGSPASVPPNKSPHHASTTKPTNAPPYAATAATARKPEAMMPPHNHNHGSAPPMMPFPAPPPGPFMNMPPPPPPPLHASQQPPPQQQQQQQPSAPQGGPFHAGMMPPPPPPMPPQPPLFAFNKVPPPPPRAPPTMANGNAMQGNMHGQPYAAQPGGMPPGGNMMAPNAPLFFANMLPQISGPPPPAPQQMQQPQQQPQRQQMPMQQQQQQPFFANPQQQAPQQQQQQQQRQPGAEGMGFMPMPPPPANMLASYPGGAAGGAAMGQAPSMMMPFPFPAMPAMNSMMPMPLPMQPFFPAAMPPPPSSMPFAPQAPQMMPPPPPPQMQQPQPQQTQAHPQTPPQQQQQQQTAGQSRGSSKAGAVPPALAPPQLPLGFGAGSPLLAPPPPPPALAPQPAAAASKAAPMPAHIQPPPMTHILPPPPPIMPVAPPLLTAKISVGNASLAALHSKEPPKFSCVLLSGIPAVGKTTLGRELVSSLKTDGMGWAFFSGADVLSEGTGKRSLWDTTKDVFDALSARLDELLEQQREHRNIKGLVIDKNCKGIEDLYYLSALLRSRSIPFVGIIGMEADQDDILIQRLGGGEELKEKLKYHRVLHARITSLAKLSGMYHYVDATRNKEEVIQALRTMVLGCCAQPPTRSIRTAHYEGTRCGSIVDRYSEYYGVMTKLFECVNTRGLQFPGSGDFVAFSTRDMTEKGRLNRLKNHYGVRRKIDGQHYLLLYHHSKLYLIPPHMRAVLEFPLKAWQGCKLDGVSAFVLEGDLTKMAGKEGERERFFVYDALYWGESGSTGNNLLRMSWSQRQTFLATSLCGEEKAATTLQDAPCLIVHHDTYDLSKTVELLDSDAYPSDGIIFQPLQSSYRVEQVLVWRPPSRLTVDFRVGARCPELEAPLPEKSTNTATHESSPGLPASPATTPATTSPTTRWGPEGGAAGLHEAHHSADSPARVFELEVYDKTEKRYMQYENATVEVRHADVVEGAIVTCSLQEQSPRSWTFQRVRYDVLRPAFRHDLDELLEYGIIPRSKLVLWLVAEQIVARPVAPVVPTTTTTKNNNNANHNNHMATPGPHGMPSFGSTPPLMASSNAAAAFLHGGHSASGAAPPPYTAATTTSTTDTNNNNNNTIASSNVAASTAAAITSAAAAARFQAPPTMLLDRQARNISALTHPMAALNMGGGAHTAPSATPASSLSTPQASLTGQTLQMSAFAAPRTTGAMETTTTTTQTGSGASQLQLLASIVPSLHVIRGNRDETAANARKAAVQQQQQHTQQQQQQAHGPRGAAIELPHPRHMDPQHATPSTNNAGHANHANASSRQVPSHCAQCHRRKEVEDLRLDKRDQKYYCYGCWAKSGWSFCAKCGEFKQGKHENRGRDKGTFYCHDCANQLRAERYEENKARNSQPQQPPQEQSGEAANSVDSTAPAATVTSTSAASKAKRESKTTAATQDAKPNHNNNNNNNSTSSKSEERAASKAAVDGGEHGQAEAAERASRNKAEAQGKAAAGKASNAPNKPRAQRRPEKTAEAGEARSEDGSTSKPKPAKKPSTTNSPTAATTTATTTTTTTAAAATNAAAASNVDGSAARQDKSDEAAAAAAAVKTEASLEPTRETAATRAAETTKATPEVAPVQPAEMAKVEETKVCAGAAAPSTPAEAAAEPAPQPVQAQVTLVEEKAVVKSSVAEGEVSETFVAVSKTTEYAMEASSSQDKTQASLEEAVTAAVPKAATSDKKNGGCMQQ